MSKKIPLRWVGALFDSCYSDDTEVLTDRGWLLFQQLTGQEKLATLNINDHSLEYQYPTQLIKKEWNNEMIHFFNNKNGIDLLVTPNHSMLVQTSKQRKKGKLHNWTLSRAEDVYKKYRYYTKTCNLYNQPEIKNIQIGNKTISGNDWLEFLGYYVSEGSATSTKNNHYIVQIRQNHNSPHFQKMATCLQKVTVGKVNTNQNNRIIVNDKNLCLYLKKLGNKYQKHIPRDILNNASSAQLKILFRAMMDRDGSDKIQAKQNGGSVYSTSSKQLKDDFQEILLKIGISGSSTKKYLKGSVVKVFNRKHIAQEDHWTITVRFKQSHITLSPWTIRKSQDFNKVTYSGYVYCATVPNHTLFVRRNGKTVWSGNSGYASATRSYLDALMKDKRVDLSVHAVSFEQQKTSHGDFTERVKPFVDKRVEHKIQVLHLTPENYVSLRNPNLYNIGYTVWETDRLPDQWVKICNSMNEIWVPSHWNVEVFRQSGVTTHIEVIPHIFHQLPTLSNNKSPVTMGVDKDVFVFYSIFQWIERKNPIGLLKAYLTEFKPDEKVCLALKTYRLNTSTQEQQLIKTEIARLKQALALPNGYPPIRFFGSLLTGEQMAGFHQRGDCFILAHRGEGFGIPLAESMIRGKPTIATNYSGNLDFMNNRNSYLIDYQITPVCNMIFPNYDGRMNWAEPSVQHLKELMRFVFENQEEAKKKGQQAKQDIEQQLSSTVIVEQIINRLKAIQEKLNG